MGTTTPATSDSGSSSAITLPPGVTVQPGRQTSQTNNQGQVVQGTLYPIVLANGTTSSVFVPDTLLPNIAQVEALFQNRVMQLQAIPVG